MTFTQKYVLVHFLQPTPDGTHFAAKNWPLHITLASNFQIRRKETGLIEKLQQFAAEQKSLSITAGSDAHFGPTGQVLVTTFDMTPELNKFHNDLVQLLRANGAIFDTPEYIESGYRPHATVRSDVRFNRGDIAMVDSFALVDMFPDEDPDFRRVIQSFTLGV